MGLVTKYISNNINLGYASTPLSTSPDQEGTEAHSLINPKYPVIPINPGYLDQEDAKK
jgi:hypothetical protein